MYGWRGTILRIDLTREKVTKQPLAESVAMDFVGGRGLNSKTLFDEVKPGIDPLSPENVLCLAPGPLSGTPLGMASRLEVSTLSPYSGILGDGNVGGSFATFLKWAGYDQIVITGRASSPKYLWIDDENVELRDAADLWGKTTWETTDILQKRHGKNISVACIGQAGGNLVRFASTIVDKHSSATRGSGAVWGSKNLKAIAVKGSGKVALANPGEFRQLAWEDREFFLEDDLQHEVIAVHGTHIGMMSWWPGYRYFQEYLSGAKVPAALRPEAWKKYEVGRTGCHDCPVGCKDVYKIPSGKYAGEEGSGLEFECIACMGTNCGVEDPIAIMEMENLADKYGMCVIGLGNAIALAKELYDRGIITAEDTGGLSLDWEDADSQIGLVHCTALREGFGNLIAEGMYSLAKIIGRGAMDYCYHVKGFSRGPHPPGLFALAHATSTRGTDHLRGRSWAYGENAPEIFPALVSKGLVSDVSKDPVGALTVSERATTISDAIGRCKGAVNSWVCAVPLVWKHPLWDGLARLLTTATGLEFDATGLEEAGERIYALERGFNVRQGITREDDRLPQKPEVRDTPQGKEEQEKHAEMLTECYRVHGYDPETGIPTRDMPPISTNLAAKDGTVSDELVFHYAERARGGVGLITVENVCIAYPLARHGAAQPRIDDDVFIPRLRRLADAIHEGGAKAAVELTHPGMNAGLHYIEEETPVAPSAVPRPQDGLIPRVLSREEVAEVIGKYVEAARRAGRAGFDAVELQACHGLLINQFLSPLTNQRQDEYGGDRENRIRFLLEIVEGIKRHVGFSFPVMVRLVAEDMLEGGLTLEDGRWFARRLEEAGADAIHPDFGLGGKEKRLEPMPYPQAWRVYLAEEIKTAVSIPVIAVGVIREPQVAEEILEAGKADFVALGRALVADPDWPNKAQAGEVGAIRRYIGCNECVVARHVEDAPLRCSLNATVGRGAETCRLERTATPKRVLIIGGGPAGMEAERVAALRGHQVTLYEREARLGGMLNVAAIPPGKEKLNWITEYFAHELPRLGVEIHLGETLEAERVRALKPDVVIIATGSEPAIPDIPGVDGPNVLVAQELLVSQMHFTRQRFAVVGGGMLGLETAEYLAVQGNGVTVLKRYETIGRSIEPLYRDYLLRELKKHGVEIMTRVEVEAIQADGVLVRDEAGEERVVPADRAVLARGATPSNEPAHALQDLGPIVIGDSVQPRKIVNAIAEGFLAAQSI